MCVIDAEVVAVIDLCTKVQVPRWALANHSAAQPCLWNVSPIRDRYQ